MGLAERRPSSTDRRARVIAVTDAGRQAVIEGTRIADRVHRDVLDALQEEQRSVFMDALALLVAGHLSTPAESGRPVRRARQKKI
jgi:DNA-binding MarR family transcriptional regulator